MVSRTAACEAQYVRRAIATVAVGAVLCLSATDYAVKSTEQEAVAAEAGMPMSRITRRGCTRSPSRPLKAAPMRHGHGSSRPAGGLEVRADPPSRPWLRLTTNITSNLVHRHLAAARSVRQPSWRCMASTRLVYCHA
jgi:hypothetical protein